MALTYGFYDSLNHDRVYSANQMSTIFNGIITDGVFQNIGEHFSVIAGTGMQVIVKPGRAWFDGTWTLLDTDYALSINASNALLSRIDAVVLETNFDVETRANSIKVVAGTPSTTPVAPTLESGDLVNQHVLAYVSVAAGATAITNSMIDIQVGVNKETPYITSVLQQTNITELYLKWEDEWYEWFNNVKTTLSGDVAANLQANIDKLEASLSDIGNLQLWECRESETDNTQYIGRSYLRIIRGDKIPETYVLLDGNYEWPYDDDYSVSCFSSVLPSARNPNIIPFNSYSCILDSKDTYTPCVEVPQFATGSIGMYMTGVDWDASGVSQFKCGIGSTYTSYRRSMTESHTIAQYNTDAIVIGGLSGMSAYYQTWVPKRLDYYDDYYIYTIDGTSFASVSGSSGSTSGPKLSTLSINYDYFLYPVVLTPDSRISCIGLVSKQSWSSYDYSIQNGLVATDAYEFGGIDCVLEYRFPTPSINVSYVSTKPSSTYYSTYTTSTDPVSGLVPIGEYPIAPSSVHYSTISNSTSSYSSTNIYFGCAIFTTYSVVDGAISPTNVIYASDSASMKTINDTISSLSNTAYMTLTPANTMTFERWTQCVEINNKSRVVMSRFTIDVSTAKYGAASCWMDVTDIDHPTLYARCTSTSNTSNNYYYSVSPANNSDWTSQHDNVTVVTGATQHYPGISGQSVYITNAACVWVATSVVKSYTYIGRIGDGGPCYTGVYYGSGTCGIDSPTSAYVPFKPRLMLFIAQVTWMSDNDYIIDWLFKNANYPIIYGENLGSDYKKLGPGYEYRTNSYAKYDDETSTVMWYDEYSPTDQFNDSWVTMVDAGGDTGSKQYLTQYFYMCI